MKIKRIVLIILLLLVFPMTVFAEDHYSEFAEKSGAYSLEENAPKEAKGYLDENGVTIDDPNTILTISPLDVLKNIWDGFKEKLKAPMNMFMCVVAVILIAALLDGMQNTVTSQGLTKVFSIISALICVGFIITPISDCIKRTQETLIDGGHFMISYVPIFSGIVAASGNISSSVCYSVIILAVSEIVVSIANLYLMPMLSICMALAIVDSINPAISLSGLLNGIKKVVVIAITFIMTIFTGLLTLQSIVGTSTDTLGIKASKFMVSSFVPVVGNAISDAYGSVIGSMNLLKSGVGSFGVITLVLTVLPTILSVTATKLSISAAEIISDMLGVKTINSLLKNVSSVLSIALGLLACFLFLLIISTAVVMIVAMNMS